MKTRRTLRERLDSEQILAGLLQTHPNVALTEMAGMCGFDFLLLDGEHGLFSEMDYVDTLQTLASTGTLAMVRVRNHDAQAVGRYLDFGADAIVVPNVTTVEQARSLVQAMVYPPAGSRGFSAPAHRVTRYGLDLAAHWQEPRGGASLLVIIESAQGVANAADILAVDGVDGVIIGPSDLSANLGRVGDFSGEYGEAFATIERAAAARGKFLGTAPHPGYPLDALIARGHRIFIVGADMPLVREAMSAQVAAARESVASAPAG